ncbi:MAG: hypothetical protein AAF394_11325 [Planctomycetota bacterium]
MKRSILVALLLFTIISSDAAQLRAQAPTEAKVKREHFNQVFVKLIIPVTDSYPMQDGPAIESWVKKRLKKLNVAEYFAVTDWVPICDGLLADDIVTNHVWGGVLGKRSCCPIGADIPERKDGRMQVYLNGWSPGGCEAIIKLDDEPGSRAVGPMQVFGGKKHKPLKVDWQMPYVAVMVAPPPMKAK